ncbi:MAG: 30S ribosomal protein S17 [Candidatus Spechtbacterales bacterium]|nr:30S ribosomal protein S17 [Candidatus Spechtbacterales bacterium]
MAKAKEKNKEISTESVVRRKKLQGKVVSDKMQDTVVVVVDRIVAHPIYKKRRAISKKYKAHCKTGEYSVGDRVEIEEAKPISKNKKWKVVKKIG